MTLVSEVVSSFMTREAAAGFGAGAGCADGEGGATWLGVAGVGVVFLTGTGVGFTCGLGAGLGAGLACGAGEPAGRAPAAACGGLVALKLFQFTQPVMATAATIRRDVWCFIVEYGGYWRTGWELMTCSTTILASKNGSEAPAGEESAMS